MTTEILIGDCIEQMRGLESGSVHCVVSSPPYYGLRDYGCPGQIGLEQTPKEYVQKMVDVFREVKRVLRDDGVCFCNLGDSYASGKGTCFNPGGGDNSLGKDKKEAGVHPLNRGNKSTLSASGLKPKDIIGIPWRVAFALQTDGWYLRQDIIWHKPNPMPESVTDRCTKSHEYVFLLTKSARYWYDAEAIRERVKLGNTGSVRSPKLGPNRPKNSREMNEVIYDEIKGANKRSVWTVSTTPYKNAHFATFPPKLIEPMILAGCPAKCCPVCGAGWVRITEHTKGRHNQRASEDQQRRCDGVISGGTKTTTIGIGLQGYNKTIGFQPSCQCNAPDHVPGTVLDPFGGSGTTAYVANAYGRNAILCELNPEYEPLIRERLGMPYEVEQEERKSEQMELFT